MAAKNLDGYLVPRADEYMGEYVPDCAERLSWLTGFTGSAGLAIILKDKAAVFSDGRYTLQMKQETDPNVYDTVLSPPEQPSAWLALHSLKGQRIGYDPRLHTGKTIADLMKELAISGIALVPVEGNLVDAVWTNRPAPPSSTVESFPELIAGRSASAKRQEIGLKIAEDGGCAAIINAPDSIAWLLNIRGSDVPHNPFALSTVIVYADGSADWFIDKARLPVSVSSSLGNQAQVLAPADLTASIDALGVKAMASNMPVLMDDLVTSVWFRQRLEGTGAAVKHQEDPCMLPKACKTLDEQKAIRAAHVRDGVAMVKFLKWIDEEAPKGHLTEQDVVDRLGAFRKAAADYRDTSFDTIAGWAGNGAIVHYRVSAATNKIITPPGILLVDSGGQYTGGTTDITRTIAVGEPTKEMKDNNTRVLKGHIAIASMKFPDGITGAQIDVLARMALWQVGLDYGHGTGHGVGIYLSVHERGVGISSRANYKFKPGMLVSNEPGYYKEGAYGIRIENLILVTEDGVVNDGSVRKRYAFETVTLAPIDRRLVDAALLNPEEVEWLNAYHKRVLDTLSPHVDEAEKKWLAQACQPL
jgi:Xaa-Pro aminopeptidase